LQRLAGNRAVSGILGHGRPHGSGTLEVSVSAPANGAQTGPAARLGRIPVQRALTVSIVSLAPPLGSATAVNPYRWQIKGRPAFSKATTSALPVASGEHRAHTTSWEDIRSTTEDALNERVDWWVFDSLIRGVFLHASDEWEFIEACLEASLPKLVLPQKKPTSGDIDLVKRFLTVANQSLDNLDEGIGNVNSKLQGHFDPKVEDVGGGKIDLTEQSREAVLYAPQLIQPLLVTKAKTYIYASTYPGGRIPVAKATGLLKEMIDGRHFKAEK
jgi:hypothetical protein